MKHLALQITPAEPAPASSEVSHSLPAQDANFRSTFWSVRKILAALRRFGGRDELPHGFDTGVHYAIVASTGAALIAGAINDWSVVVMAIVLVPFVVIVRWPNAPSGIVFGAPEAVENLRDAIRSTRASKRSEDPGWSAKSSHSSGSSR
jgi:hypothetical protein